MKKTTRATIKSFIKKNKAALFIKYKSNFDGMTDCVMPTGQNSFEAAQDTTSHIDNTLGIKGAWFVGGAGGSKDWFKPFNVDGFTGYSVSNCCGSFVIAVKS